MTREGRASAVAQEMLNRTTQCPAKCWSLANAGNAIVGCAEIDPETDGYRIRNCERPESPPRGCNRIVTGDSQIVKPDGNFIDDRCRVRCDCSSSKNLCCNDENLSIRAVKTP